MFTVNDLFNFNILFKVGALVFSLVALIFTIQLYANVVQVSKSVLTKRNRGIRFTSLLFIVGSIVFFLFAVFFL